MTIPKPDLDRTVPTTPAEEQRKGSGLWLGLAALLPIACCGLPLLVAAGAAAGTGAIHGGAAGVVLLAAAVILAVVTVRRRRDAACRTDVVDGTAMAKKGCC